MCKQRMVILAVIALLNIQPALANGRSCQEAVRPLLQDDSNMKLWVHEFGPGKHDLALGAESGSAEIKRVSFSAKEDACAYRPLAIERGGDWGWHLVWSEQNSGVFYARMDGEAWVSSPRKSIAPLPVREVEFKVSGQHLIIRWHDDTSQRFSRTSQDEGRSWD